MHQALSEATCVRKTFKSYSQFLLYLRLRLVFLKPYELTVLDEFRVLFDQYVFRRYVNCMLATGSGCLTKHTIANQKREGGYWGLQSPSGPEAARLNSGFCPFSLRLFCFCPFTRQPLSWSLLLCVPSEPGWPALAEVWVQPRGVWAEHGHGQAGRALSHGSTSCSRGLSKRPPLPVGVGSPRNVRYKRFPYQLLTYVSTDRKGVILFGSVLFSRTSFNGDVAGGCHCILRSLSCFKRRNGPSTCGVHLSQIMQFANRLDQFEFF